MEVREAYNMYDFILPFSLFWYLSLFHIYLPIYVGRLEVIRYLISSGIIGNIHQYYLGEGRYNSTYFLSS